MCASLSISARVGRLWGVKEGRVSSWHLIPLLLPLCELLDLKSSLSIALSLYLRYWYIKLGGKSDAESSGNDSADSDEDEEDNEKEKEKESRKEKEKKREKPEKEKKEKKGIVKKEKSEKPEKSERSEKSIKEEGGAKKRKAPAISSRTAKVLT